VEFFSYSSLASLSIFFLAMLAIELPLNVTAYRL